MSAKESGSSNGAAKNAAGKAKNEAQDAARNIESSKWYQRLVTVGLISYGVIHLLFAFLIVRLALGDSSEETSNSGAIEAITKAPGGAILLGVIGVGLLALVVWQAVAAVVGYREYDEGKRIRKRLAAVGRGIVFAVLAGTALVATFKGDSSDSDSEQSTAQGLFGLPGGVFIVGAVGLGIIGFGIYQCFAGITAKFNEELDTELQGVGRGFATAGFIGKGLAIATIGGLFLAAALQHNPEEAGGMDEGLKALQEQPFGPPLLIAIAVGIGCYGIWCFYYAKHKKHA